jgi:exodeoxyribonuclease-5
MQSADSPIQSSIPEPSDEQQRAITAILQWFDGGVTTPQELSLGGYAGTGKTTVIKHIIERLGAKGAKVRVASFTGKAVSVLRKKAVDADTIHSLMYYPYEEPKGVIQWHKKSYLDDDKSSPSNPDLVIIDEASMVSTPLYRDLISFEDVKFLWVGDPGQLEPVGDNPNLMMSPKILLEKIHRQAEKSAIIKLSMEVRNGRRFSICESSELVVTSKNSAEKFLGQTSQVIVAFNRERHKINARLRGFRNELLTVGEKLIILRNDWQQGVYNGMMVNVEQIHYEGPDHFLCTVVDELGRRLHRLKIWKGALGQDFKQDTKVPFKQIVADYGYCITVHKSQGSEWDSVLVLESYAGFAWNMDRWRYTAVTRAANRLIYGR